MPPGGHIHEGTVLSEGNEARNLFNPTAASLDFGQGQLHLTTGVKAFIITFIAIL